MATVVCCLFSCTNLDEEFAPVIKNPVPQEVAKTRTLAEAIEVANNATGMLGEAKTRSIYRSADLTNIHYVLSSPTRATGSQDTLLYVINYTGNNGFAVVSANKGTEALLAVTENGSYNDENAQENPGLGLFMNLAEDYVSTASFDDDFQKPLVPNPPGGGRQQIKYVNDTTTTKVDPLLEVAWGQDYPYNMYALNYKTGCANTAMAQVMSYFEHPQSIALTYDGATKSDQILNWTEMKMHKNSYNCQHNGSCHEAIAQLMRQLGQLSNSSYIEGGGTSTTDNAVRSTLNSLGYQVPSSYTSYTYQTFYTELSNNKLIVFGGKEITSAGEFPHMWIIDGTINYTVHMTTWQKIGNQILWTLLSDDGYFEEHYLHINWGWDGDANGYFYANIFNTMHPKEYDNPDSYVLHDADFEYSLKFITVTR